MPVSLAPGRSGRWYAVTYDLMYDVCLSAASVLSQHVCLCFILYEPAEYPNQ